MRTVLTLMRKYQALKIIFSSTNLVSGYETQIDFFKKILVLSCLIPERIVKCHHEKVKRNSIRFAEGSWRRYLHICTHIHPYIHVFPTECIRLDTILKC